MNNPKTQNGHETNATYQSCRRKSSDQGSGKPSDTSDPPVGLYVKSIQSLQGTDGQDQQRVNESRDNSHAHSRKSRVKDRRKSTGTSTAGPGVKGVPGRTVLEVHIDQMNFVDAQNANQYKWHKNDSLSLVEHELIRTPQQEPKIIDQERRGTQYKRDYLNSQHMNSKLIDKPTLYDVDEQQSANGESDFKLGKKTHNNSQLSSGPRDKEKEQEYTSIQLREMELNFDNQRNLKQKFPNEVTQNNLPHVNLDQLKVQKGINMQVTYLKAQTNAAAYQSGQNCTRNNLMIDSRSSIDAKATAAKVLAPQKQTFHQNQQKSFAARLLQNQTRSTSNHNKKLQSEQGDLLKSVQITGNSFTAMRRGADQMSKDIERGASNQDCSYQSFRIDQAAQDKGHKNKQSASSQLIQGGQFRQDAFLLQGMSQNSYLSQAKPIPEVQPDQVTKAELASLDSEARNYQEFIIPQEYYNQKKRKQQKLSLAQAVSQDKVQRDMIRHSYKVSPSNWEQLMQNTASGKIQIDSSKSPPKQSLVGRQLHSQRKINDSSRVKRRNNRLDQKQDTDTNNSLSSTGVIGLHGIYKVSGQKMHYGPDLDVIGNTANRSNSQKQRRLSQQSESFKQQSNSNIDSQETFKHVIHINEKSPCDVQGDQIINIKHHNVARENEQATLYAEKEAGTSTVLVETSRPSNELVPKIIGDGQGEIAQNQTFQSSLYQSKPSKRQDHSIQIYELGQQQTFDSQDAEFRPKKESQNTSSRYEFNLQSQLKLEQLNPDLVDAKSILLKNQGTSNPQLMSLSGEDLQTKKKHLNRNTTTGTSEDNGIQIRNSIGDKSSRYGEPKIDTQGFKLIGSRVKQLQHVGGGITPIESQIRPCITSHDNPRGIQYASSAASYYDVASPLKKISPSQATKTNRGSVKSSGVFTQNLDSERPKHEKTEFSKRSSKSKEVRTSEIPAQMSSPSPIKLDKITSLAREVPPQRSLSQDEQDTKQVKKISKPMKPIKRYPQQVFQLLSILRNQNVSQATKSMIRNVEEEQKATNYATQLDKLPGDQNKAEGQQNFISCRESLLLNDKCSDSHRRKSLDAVSNSNTKNRMAQYQTQPIDFRAIRSQMHLSAKTDEYPREGAQFPDDAVLALVPYVAPNGEIKETAVMLRESSGINNGQASTLIRNDPSSAFGQRSTSMQERPEALVNADIRELIPYVSIRKHVSNAVQTDGNLKLNEDLQRELSQDPEKEFFTTNAAEEQELFNHFEFRQRQKLVKSSNPFFNVQRKSQIRAQSVNRQNAGSQLAMRKNQILNERRALEEKKLNKTSDFKFNRNTKQAMSPTTNALVQGVKQQIQPSTSPQKSIEQVQKKQSLGAIQNKGGIKCQVEKKHSVQDKMIRINKDDETKSKESKSICETEKGAQTRSNNRIEEIKVIQDNLAQRIDQDPSIENTQEEAFITSVSMQAPKSTEQAANKQKQASKEIILQNTQKPDIKDLKKTNQTSTMNKIYKNNRQKEALEKLKKRQQLEVEKDYVGKIILPVNSWEYRLMMQKSVGKKSLATIKSRTQAPHRQLMQSTAPNSSQLPRIRTDPTEDPNEIEQSLTNKQVFTHKSSEGRLGRRTVLQQHTQLSSGDGRQSAESRQLNQTTFITDQVLVDDGIMALPSNIDIQNNHEMAIFEESLISENFKKEEAATANKNQEEKIFKDSWKINQIGQNFESSLYKEVMYLKETKQRYDKNTSGQRLPNAVLDKEKLISTTKIPNIILETNKGTIMKNRRPAKQSRSFSLSQLNMRQISRRQDKSTGKNLEAYQDSQFLMFGQKHVTQPKFNSSMVSSQNSQDLLQIGSASSQEAQNGPYAITAMGSQILGSETRQLTAADAHSSTGNIPYPKRSQFSRLNSMGYKCDVSPDCDIKALRSKNLGSQHDPDPTSLLKLRFKKKDYRDKTSTFSQGVSTKRERPTGSRRFGSGSFNETGFMSVTSSQAQHQKVVPRPDHMRIYPQTRQMTKRAHGHFKKYLNHI